MRRLHSGRCAYRRPTPGACRNIFSAAHCYRRGTKGVGGTGGSSRVDKVFEAPPNAARREATEAAAATQAVSRGALIAALSLLLGAVAAWFGGRMGAVQPAVTEYVTVRVRPAE
jgi:hypothetical protein